MTTLIIIIFIFSLLFLVGKNLNKPADVKENKLNNNDVYKIYSNWCEYKKETPMTKEEFEKLANEQGSIDIADLLNKHDKINPNQKVQNIYETKTTSENEYEVKLKEEVDEQKKRDDKFVDSTIAGYISNSTTKGTLLGGSLLGGMFGDYLNKKPKK